MCLSSKRLLSIYAPEVHLSSDQLMTYLLTRKFCYYELIFPNTKEQLKLKFVVFSPHTGIPWYSLFFNCLFFVCLFVYHIMMTLTCLVASLYWHSLEDHHSFKTKFHVTQRCIVRTYLIKTETNKWTKSNNKCTQKTIKMTFVSYIIV